MKYSKLVALSAISMSLLLSGCNKDKPSDPKSTTNQMASFARFQWVPKSDIEAAQIRIINSFGEPVAGAQILIGDAQGTPFANNLVTTNASGVATVPNNWKTPASITVDAAGYIRQTLLNQPPGNMSIRLNTAYLSARAEVRGEVTGLPVVNGDGQIDFALAMPVMTRQDLLNFDLGQVISPYTDTLSAAGQKSELPSNISLPKQKENYIIGITLQKPVYRLKMSTLGPKKFVTARGRFNFKKVVGELRKGKAFYELINDFSILGGGTAGAVLAGPQTNLDIPGTQMDFSQQVTLNPVSPQSDEIVMVLATSEMNGSMLPTDVKRAEAGQSLTLNTLPNAPTYIVSVVKKQSEFMSTTPGSDRMSASLLPYSSNISSKMLPLIANPSINTSGAYVISLPETPHVDGINPTATSAAISDLVETTDGDKKVVIAVRKWEILGSGWSQSMTLPQWPLLETNTKTLHRVEVNYIGSATSKSTALDDSLTQNATHVTHASTDF